MKVKFRVRLHDKVKEEIVDIPEWIYRNYSPVQKDIILSEHAKAWAEDQIDISYDVQDV